MDKTQTLDQLLIQLYKRLDIYDTSLQDNCLNCKYCWEGMEERKWSDLEVEAYLDDDDTDPTKLYMPWIGEHYNKQRLLIIGINMNHYGGTYAQRIIVDEWVRTQLKEGKKMILRNEDYSGSHFWHRVPSYSSVLIEQSGNMEFDWDEDGFPSGESLSQTFEYFSITNSVKCSPKGEKSKPTSQMWDKCLSHILKEEIKILNPHQILILGSSENFYYFKNEILDKPENVAIEEFNYFKKGKASINNNIVEFYSVIHPTARGGNAKYLIQEFKEFVYYDKAYLIEELKKQLQVLGYELEISNSKFGSANSGFYLKIPGWNKFSIGFEFEMAWANSFFYGLKRIELTDDFNLELLKQIHSALNMQESPTGYWPFWKWNKYKNWNDQTFKDIETGLFLKNIKEIADDIILKTKDLDL